jgi:hypothetical protein
MEELVKLLPDQIGIAISGLQAVLISAGILDKFDGYNTFPLNYVSTTEDVGIRVLSVSPDLRSGKVEVLIGVGRCFLVKAYPSTGSQRGVKIEEASIVAGKLAALIGLAIDHSKDCAPGIAQILDIATQLNVIQNDEIAGSLRALLQEINGEAEEYQQSIWVAQVLVKAKLVIS